MTVEDALSLPERVGNTFEYFFDKFGNFIDMLVLILLHLGFWVTILLFVAIFIGIFWTYLRLRKPITKIIKQIRRILNKFKL